LGEPIGTGENGGKYQVKMDAFWFKDFSLDYVISKWAPYRISVNEYKKGDKVYAQIPNQMSPQQ